jgi:GTPase SAR1 family protein
MLQWKVCFVLIPYCHVIAGFVTQFIFFLFLALLAAQHQQVPVIVAENKMDLFRPSSSAAMTDEQALARKRQQIVSLMQRFPFVRQCIKCSAKNLLRVDDVFLKAQQAVLYPFTPPSTDLARTTTVECKGDAHLSYVRSGSRRIVE